MTFLSIGLLCGCGQISIEQQKYSTQTESLSTAETSDTATLPTTQPPTEPPYQTVTPSAEKFVYDYADVLTEDEENECSEYARYLYSAYLVNTAVVTSEKIGDYSPYEYAQYAYDQIYQGRGSGLLILINNDSFNDYIYTTGNCKKFIPKDSIKIAFSLATRDIVEENYKSAVMRMLSTGELCPPHVFDNAEVFSEDDVKSLETKLNQCVNSIAVLATSNTTDSKNEDVCRMYCQRHFTDGNGTMIMIDVNSKSVTVFSSTQAPADFKKILESANLKASEEKFAEAVNIIIDAVES